MMQNFQEMHKAVWRWKFPSLSVLPIIFIMIRTGEIYGNYDEKFLVLNIATLKSWIFPDDWEKGNIVPVHKKNSKQLVNNYCPVSLLPICSKSFEKLISNSIFNFMIQNNLLNSCQSSFRPNDSCINQLISITHNIYGAFDANPSLEV